MKQLKDLHDIKNVAVYTRVSSKEQVDEGHSLETQEKYCREYSKSHNFNILEPIFIEKGESAKTANRTELLKLMKFVSDSKNKIDAVVVYKLDRLSRNRDDYGAIKAMFTAQGIRIVSVTERTDDNPYGRLFESQLVIFSQFDNEIRAERCTNGLKFACEQGRYVFPPPLGYLRQGGHGTMNITPDSKYAPLIKKTFELIASGFHSAEDVRKIMAKNGLTKKDGRPLNKSHFYKLVRNQVYAGRIQVPTFGIDVQGTFEPIIEKPLFDAVQQILVGKRARNQIYKKANDDFPLRGTLKHECGYSLTGAWSRGNTKHYPKYRCSHCKGVNPDRDTLHNNFIEYLKTIRLNKEAEELLKISLEYNWDKIHAQNINQIKELANKEKMLKEKRKSIVDKNINGVLNDELTKELLSDVESELADISIENLRYEKPIENREEIFNYALSFLKNLPEWWIKNTDAVTRREFQKFFFPHGIMYDGEKLRTLEKLWIVEINQTFTMKNYPKVEVRGIEPLCSCFLKEASPKTARIVYKIEPENRAKKRYPPSLIQFQTARGAQSEPIRTLLLLINRLSYKGGSISHSN